MTLPPYRIKVVEPLPVLSRSQRERAIAAAGYNTFQLPADAVTVDLISDSGTGAMSSAQWSAMVTAREDFSGQAASRLLRECATRLTGMRLIQPVHQGRAAERHLLSLLLRPGDTVLSNCLFETTRANVEANQAVGIDLPQPRARYAGDIDLHRLDQGLKRESARLVLMTVTSNTGGGQPASLENIRAAAALARRRKVPFMLDACRFADNAFLIKERAGLDMPVRAICWQMFNECDVAYLSAKKDCLSNIGGFIALRSRSLAARLRQRIIAEESYPDSGGLAARDLAAMAVGLEEAIDEPLLAHHIGLVRHLAAALEAAGVPVHRPVGAHGVVIRPPRDASFAAHALAVRIYVDTGVRGGVFGNELRLAVPRRVYQEEHLEYVARQIGQAYRGRLPTMVPRNAPREFTNFFIRFSMARHPSRRRNHGKTI